MATTDTPSTLTELQTAFLRYVKETSSSPLLDIITSYLNQALQDMHQDEHFWWQERRATIITKPPYSTGSVSVDKGATSVTGSSTAWTTTDDFGNANAADADKITIGGSTDVYTISGTPGATSLTLGSRFTGEDVTDGSYTVFQDEYALASDFGDVCDARIFSDDMHIDLIGAKEFNREYPRNSQGGTPGKATLLELGPSGSAALRRRVLFGPRPDDAYTIPYRYYTTNLAVSSAGVGAANLSASTDQPIVPLRYRMGIVWKALELWFGSRQRDEGLAANFGGRYSTVMLRARAGYGATKDIPRIVPGTRRTLDAAKHPFRWTRSRGYSTGTEFEDLRI